MWFFDDHIIDTFLAGIHTELGIQRDLFSVKSDPKNFLKLTEEHFSEIFQSS